jgi:phosphoglycolate phosphatase
LSESPRLIVFDLDGTLIDSRRDLADSANALLASCGAAPLSEEQIGRMVGDGAATLVARAFEASGVARPPDALDRFLALYDERLMNNTRPYQGIPEVLEIVGLRARLAVLTNKPLASTRRILAGFNLARHFADDAVVGGDGPLPRKPDPGGLQHLARLAKVGASATLLVGDSIVDFRTARAASVRICLARYGFGFEGFPRPEIRPSDRVIDAPADLLAL